MLPNNNRQAIFVKRLLFPGFAAFFTELVATCLLFAVLNFAIFEKQLFGGSASGLNFNSFANQAIYQALTGVSGSHIASRIILFLMYALVGALIYVLVYRLFQALRGMSSSLREGVLYLETRQKQGIARWLDNAHNTIINFVIGFIGLATLTSGILLAFALASQQLQNGFEAKQPFSSFLFVLSGLSIIVGARTIMIGICLVVPRFGRWYVA